MTFIVSIGFNNISIMDSITELNTLFEQIDQVISNELSRHILKQFIIEKRNNIQNDIRNKKFIFYGTGNNGKTTLINNIANYITIRNGLFTLQSGDDTVYLTNEREFRQSFDNVLVERNIFYNFSVIYETNVLDPNLLNRPNVIVINFPHTF